MGLESSLAPGFRRVAWPIVAAATVATLLGGPSLATAEAIAFEWHHAGGDVHRPGGFVPFHAVLENPTGEDRWVRLEGRWDGLFGEVHHRIELAAGARKEVDFYLGPADHASDFDVTLRSLAPDGAPGKVLEEVHLSSVPLQPGRRVVGILDPHPLGWGSLRRSGDFDGKVIHLEPIRLPGAAHGLGAFDVLIWPRPRPWELRGEQLRALSHWLDDGGHLVLAGPQVGRHALEPWTRVVAGEPLPVHRLDSLAGVAGVPLPTFEEPLFVTPLETPSGQVWLRETWGTLAATESRGLGRLTVLGFDPGVAAIAGWPGLGSFWLRLLDRHRLSAPKAGGRSLSYLGPSTTLGSRSVARELLTVERGGPALPVVTLGFLLVLYLAAIGPGEYYLLRRVGKLKWTWLTFPLWVGLASVGAYAVAAGTRGKADFTRHILLRELAPGAGAFREQLHASLFVSSAGSHRLTSRRPGALPRALSDPFSEQYFQTSHLGSGGSGWMVTSGSLGPGGRLRISGGEMEVFQPIYQQGAGAISSQLTKWSFLTGSFEGRVPVDGMGVAAELERLRGGLAGKIVPRLGHDLAGAWLLTSSGGRPVRARLTPGLDGEPIPVPGPGARDPKEPWDARLFAPQAISNLQHQLDGRLERFVHMLAIATVRDLLLRQLSQSENPWPWGLLASPIAHPDDWSELLESGGAVFLGWAPDTEARLDLDAPADGLVVYRIGIAPETIGTAPVDGSAAISRRGTEL